MYQRLGQALAFVRRNGANIGIEVGVNFLAPFLIYSLAKPRLGDVGALMASSGPPIAWSVVGFVRQRRIDAVSALVLAGIALSLLAFVGVGHDPRVLQLRERLVTGLIGLVFLGSAAIGRPLIYYLARATMLRRRQTEAAASFEALRDNRYFRRTMMVMTLVWGFGLIVDCAAHVALVFMVPIKTYLLVGRPVGWVFAGVLALWTFFYARRQRRLGEARRAAQAENEARRDQSAAA